MYKLFLLTFLILLLYFFFAKKENFIKRQTLHNKLYEIWDKLQSILEKHEIQYFADGGTLLGAYRDKKIISHDDDIDIGIMKKDVHKLFLPEFTKDLEKNYLKFDTKYYVYKIFPTDNLNQVFIDIFVYENKGKKIQFVEDKHKNFWPNAYFNDDELFPLKSYTFGHKTIYGAFNPIPYFERQYGTDWMIPMKSHNHHHIIEE